MIRTRRLVTVVLALVVVLAFAGVAQAARHCTKHDAVAVVVGSGEACRLRPGGLAGSILPHLRRQACRLQVQASSQTRSCAWQYTSGMKVHCPALEPGSAQPGTRHGPSRTMCSSRD